MHRLFLPALLLVLSLSCPRLLPAQEYPTFSRLKETADDYSLPLVNLETEISSVNRNSYVEGKIEIFDPQAPSANNSFSYHCMVRYRGATSLAHEKKSFAVKLTDAEGNDLDADIFGIRPENSWILNAMAIDRIRMRDRICFDLWNEMSGTPYPTPYGNRNGTEGRFVELFLNGNYHGLYCFTDKIDRKLLALKKAKAQSGGLASIRGILYKGDAWTSAIMLGDYDKSAPTDTTVWNGWGLQYPDDYPSADTWQPLADLIDFCNGPDFASGYTRYFYPDNTVDYATLILAFNIRDINFKNSFLSTPDIRSGTRFLITPWDLDTSLGGEWNGQYFDEMSEITTMTVSRPFKKLYYNDIDGFKQRLQQRWAGLSSDIFRPSAINRRLDDYAQSFTASGAWQREYERWNQNPVPLHENINDELDYVKDWYFRNYIHLCLLLNVEPTGIEDTPRNTDEVQPVELYTVEGIRIPHLQKGINILRYPDGSTRKVWIKAGTR